MMKRKNKKGWLVIALAKRDIQWFYRLPCGESRQGEGEEGLPAPETVNALLLLPTEQIFLMKVNAGHHQAKAWQMEPWLTEDIDCLHITELLPARDGGLMAAIAPALLQDALIRLQRLGYVPLRILPDAIAVPEGHALWFRHRWLISRPGGEPMSLSEQTLQRLLPAYPELSSLTYSKENVLETLAGNAVRCEATLLKPPRPRFPGGILLPAMAVALLLGSLFAEPIWQGIAAHRAMASLNQQALQRYQTFFPQEIPDDPLRAFSKKALALETNAAESGLLSLLEQVAPLLAPLKTNPLQAFSWDAQQRQLHLTFARKLPGNLGSQAPQGAIVVSKAQQLIITQK